MKKIFFMILTLMMSFSLFAVEKQKQKQIPFEVSSHFAQNLLQVTFRAESTVNDFSIIRVRGLDGVTISKFQEIINLSLNAGDTAETQIEISNLTGRAYVVLDIEYKLNGILNQKNIPLPVGNLSTGQITERKKHIKTIKVKKNSTSNQQKGIPQTTDENVHYMKID